VWATKSQLKICFCEAGRFQAACLTYFCEQNESLMKQSLLSFLLIFTAFFYSVYSCEKPKVVGLTPCDEAFIEKVVSWKNDLMSASLDVATDALTEIVKSGSNCHDRASDSLVAEAWHTLGNAYNNKGDYESARYYFEKGLALRGPVLGHKHKDVLRSYHMVGFMCAKEKDYDIALNYYKLADVLTTESAAISYVLNLTRTGVAYKELKEFSTAKMYLRKAFNTIRKDSISFNWLSEALFQYSTCCRATRQFLEAIEKGKESLEAAPLNKDQNESMANAYLAIGNAYQDSALYCQNPSDKRRLFAEARKYSTKAKEIYQGLLPNDRGLTILTIGNISELYRRDEQPDEAQKVLNEVLDTFSNKRAPELAQFYMIRGKAWTDKRQYQNALTDFDAALSCLVPSYQSNGNLPPLSSPTHNRFDLLELLGDIASAQLAQSNTNAAAVTFDTLLNLLNLIRGDFLSDEAKIALAGDSRQILEKAFGGYVQLYEATGKQEYLERAFSISEQRKSFALLEAARLNNADAGLPDDLRQQKRALAKEQADIEQRLLAYWNNPDSTGNLRAAQLRNLERSRELQLTIKKKYPKYDKLKQKGSDLDIATIQKEMLGENQAMLQYFCRDTLLDIFLIGKNSFKRYTSRIDRLVLEQKVNKFLEFSANPSTGGERDTSKENTLSTLAHELYLTLLQPVKNDLPKRVIIIPDAPFTTLPFEALAKNKIAGDIRKQIESRNFVLYEHALSYCFSANLLREMQQSESPSSLDNAVAAFAPNFPERLVAGANLPESFTRTVKDLKPLGNREEVAAIGENVSVKAYLDTVATVDGFFEACRRYAFVHVATHGILNQDPNLNFVAFTQSKDTLNEKELLFLRRLYTEDLPQDLIVFSACETTLGEFREGEGNMSMARGLAYAGVRSFVTTLWKVYTASNTEIMPEFYQNFLNEDKPKDVALNEAKIAFIEASSNNEPMDKWAGLVLIGSTETTRSSGWAWWVVAAVVVGGLLLFWANRRRQSPK
jgi:CHAT domain-containing protein